MSNGDYRAELEAELDAILAGTRKAFEGKYKKEVDALHGLSRAEIDEMTPDATDLETYDALIEVVKEASRQNMAQANLAARIKGLGEIAVKIAGKVPKLAAIIA